VATLRIGTRGSALARVQAEHVAGLLRERLPDLRVQTIVITVSGDERLTDGPGPATATAIPQDKTRWVDHIEEALRADTIDLAVHSAKDVPAQLGDGLALLGAPDREDPRDVLCGAATLADLASGARVGTSSVRRAAQLRALREDLQVLDLRGNVDTRVRRLTEGAFDAIVLAYAGLRRLGLADETGWDPAILGPLDADAFVPAPGQGTLALQGRHDDADTALAAQAISDRRALAALTAERALTSELGATCHTPVGAYASWDGARESLSLSAFIGLPDGSAWIRDRLDGSAADPVALGRAVAERLQAVGAEELLRRAEEMALANA
jgi:hydroxymethylbilane synthase